MKSYPLGVDNPILVKGVFGTHRWALYWKETMEKIAEFNDQNSAIEYRSHLLTNSRKSMIRKITTHPSKSINFTPAAQEITQKLNDFRRQYGDVSFKTMAKIFGLRETNCANYYYGRHHYVGGYYSGVNYTQVRRGACVSI